MMKMKGIVMVMVMVVVVEGAVVMPAGWRSAQPDQLTRKNRDSEEWCDDVLGCLTITDDWYVPSRPINCLPYKRSTIDTNFMLHTRANRAEEENVPISADRTSVDATTFDPSKPIKFITHGFIDTGNIQWLKDMALAFLDYDDYNVIRTDWGGGSLPMYCTAAGNIRVVGLEIGYLVNFLIREYGVDPANVHLLGHSLGSHASGYAGEQIPGLGRISGMDPAGPYFTDTPDFIRIDPTDATFVDNIHTDADMIFMLGYGTDQAMGHLDFYPNSGHDQPGCDPVSIGIEIISPGDLTDGIRDLGACSHARAYKYFTESIGESCPYLAHECYEDYNTFEQGRCATCADDNSKCAYMGIHADQYTHKTTRENVKMYFDTDDDAPFCYYHYQMVVDTASPKGSEEWVQGHLTVTLFGDNGQVITDLKVTDEHERFDHGQLKYFLFKSHTDLSRVIRMEAHWVYDDTLTNPGSYCWMLLCNRALYIRSIRISPMEYYPEETRLDHVRTLCQFGHDYVEIKTGNTEPLTWDETCQFTGGP